MFQRFIHGLRTNHFKILVTAGVTSCLIGSSFFVKHKSTANVARINNKLNSIEPNQLNNNGNSIRGKFNFIDKIVKKCAPAVVLILIKDQSRHDPKTGDASITSNGSGFIISDDGYILSNAHVVMDKPQSVINVVTNDGQTFIATIKDLDSVKDIALLKINTNEKLHTLDFADDGDVIVGEWVVALGSPLSLNNTVSVGIVSSINRSAEELGLRNYSMKYIQTDASITFGNSGGPLVNLDGRVIGINNLRLTSGISFAIPVDYVKKFLGNGKFLRQVPEMRVFNKKMLFYGITTISVTTNMIKELLRNNKNIPEEITEGLLVWKVMYDSLSQKSGLETGDIITHINGVPVKETSDIYTHSGSEKSVIVRIIREGKKKDIYLQH